MPVRFVCSDMVGRALRACPRGLFVPTPHADEAYIDAPIRVSAMGFNISAPHMHATMLQAMDIQPGDRWVGESDCVAEWGGQMYWSILRWLHVFTGIRGYCSIHYSTRHMACKENYAGLVVRLFPGCWMWAVAVASLQPVPPSW